MPRATVVRRVHFNAAHRLHNPARTDEWNRQAFGPCNNPNFHGHNYEADLHVEGEVDPETGYVLDVAILKALFDEHIHAVLDHRNLNLDVPWFADRLPSAENIASSSGKRWPTGSPPASCDECGSGRRPATTSSTRGREMSGALRDRLALVTGASRGIGAATAVRLTALGATVLRVARSAMPPMDLAVDYRADLADPRDRDEFLERVHTEHGVPHLVINNAGAFLLAPLEDTTDALLREQLAINLEAPFAIARFFLPLMRKRGSGRHILVGSVSDSRAFPENAAYSASKYGARGLHEVLLEEYRGSGVQCCLVSPGPTDTTVWDPFDPDAREGFLAREAMLRPDDVADAIVWAATRPVRSHVESVRLGPG